MYWVLSISLSLFLQLFMESQQVLANLLEQSFLSASSSKDNILQSRFFVNVRSSIGECAFLCADVCFFHRELQENLVRSHSAGNKAQLIFKMSTSQCSWQNVLGFAVFKISPIDVILWCVGVGNPLSPERTRMLLALRINVLAKGYSGISLETLHAMIQAFNGKPPALLYLILPGISASVDCW